MDEWNEGMDDRINVFAFKVNNATHPALKLISCVACQVPQHLRKPARQASLSLHGRYRNRGEDDVPSRHLDLHALLDLWHPWDPRQKLPLSGFYAWHDRHRATGCLMEDGGC